MISLIDKKKIMSYGTIVLFFSIILFLYITFLFQGVPHYNNIIGNICFFTLNLIVVITLFYVAKKSSKYGKNAFRGWFLIALSQIATLLGNILWIVLSIRYNQFPYPSVADIFYLLYYPLLIAGILYLPVTQTKEFKKYQILIDTGILMISATMVLWVILIHPILENQKENTIVIVTSLSYVLLDIFMLVTLFYLLFNWFGRVKKIPMLLLSMSAATLVVTNVIFTYQSLYGIDIIGGFLDIGWLLSYILTALAGISYINDHKYKFNVQYKFSALKFNWSSYLPLLWLLFVYILLFCIYIHPGDINILVLGVAIIITMIFTRQILALMESNRIKELLKTNQEILTKRERHLSLITDNMMDLISRTDPNGIYQYISPSAKKILGYNPENLLGQNVFDFVHPEDQENFKSSLLSSIENGHLNETEFRYKKSSGDYIWLETVGTPIFDHENTHKGFIRSSRNIDYRKHAEKQIKNSLEEKEVLLKEIHHRVKNNMQVISSLLSLQSRSIKNEEEIEILRESQNRVKSMAMIHESLYRTHNLARINFKEYIKGLISGLFRSYGVNQSTIKLELNLKDVLLDIDIAIPCGLILNELISNSLKHAFPANYVRRQANGTFASPEGMKGKIKVSLLLKNESILKMIVFDNGIGFPDNIDFRNTDSLGLKLVNTLINQLDGTIELEKSNGTKFIIEFKKNKY